MVGRRLLRAALPALVLVPLISTTASGNTTCSYVGNASGTIEFAPELGLLQNAPVGNTPQSNYFKTTSQNRDFRRAFVEFALPDFGDFMVNARLVLPETRGTTSFPLPPDTHELSWYQADLVVNTADYSRPTAPIGTFQTDNNEPRQTFTFDVTSLLTQSGCGPLGFRVKLAADPSYNGNGFLGTQFGAPNSGRPVRIEVDLAPGAPDCGDLFTLTCGNSNPIVVSPTYLPFSAVAGGPNPAAGAISITASAGTLEWTATEEISWLSLSSTSGSTPATVNASVDISGLAPGVYSGNVTIDGGEEGGSQFVTVTLTVTPPPQIQVSPTQLSFSAAEGDPNPAARAISITASGGGTLAWTATEEIPWLSLSSTSGSTPATVQAAVDISGLAPGLYSGNVTIQGGAQGGSKVVTVSLYVFGEGPGWNDPAGDVSNPHSDAVAGLGIISGDLVDLRIQFVQPPYPTTATQNITWCFDTDNNRATGSACGPWPGADTALTLEGGLGALETGSFSIGPWGVHLDPCAIGSYDHETNTIRLLVPRSVIGGSGDFHYAIESAFGGSFGANEDIPNAIDFGSPGGYLIATTGTPEPFSGGALCVTPSQIQVSPTYLPLSAVEGGPNPAASALSITASPGGTLAWTATEEISWLSLSSTSGSTPATVDAAVDISGLAPGVYSGNVTIDAGEQGGSEVVNVALIVNSSDPSAGGPCPHDLAGKLGAVLEDDPPYPEPQVSFQWYEYFGHHSMTAGDTVTLELAIVPFHLGSTFVGMDEIEGRTGYGLNFGNDGLVNGLVPYTPDAWNSVRAVYNFGTHTYTLTVNGQSSAPVPFDFSDSSSMQSFRLHSFDADEPTTAWVDSIALTVSSPSGTTALFGATFDDGTEYTGYPGTIESLPPPDDLPIPGTCQTPEAYLIVTIDKNHLAWTSMLLSTRSDIVTRRIASPFDGVFATFTVAACSYQDSTFDIAYRGQPPAGSVDLWLVRTWPDGVAGSWDEGGHQAAPRTVPFCTSP